MKEYAGLQQIFLNCVPIYTDSASLKVFYRVAVTPSTWDQAVAYCRAHYKDLAMIESASENTQVATVLKSYEGFYIWIGLYREPWRWSDNTISSFANWMSGQPDHQGNDLCAAESADRSWDNIGCDWKLNFYCHGGEIVSIF